MRCGSAAIPTSCCRHLLRQSLGRPSTTLIVGQARHAGNTMRSGRSTCKGRIAFLEPTTAAYKQVTYQSAHYQQNVTKSLIFRRSGWVEVARGAT